MARRSQRLSGPNSAHKRTHSDDIQSADKRARPGPKTLPTKSRYFTQGGNAEVEDNPGETDQDEVSINESSPGDASDFNTDGSESPDSHNDDKEIDYDSEESRKPRRKSASSKGTKSTATIRSRGNELWRPGVSAGLGPGTQVIIKKPKARPAGKTPYLDETIHPNTLIFLGELKENNDRQWLKSKLLSPIRTASPSYIRAMYGYWNTTSLPVRYTTRFSAYLWIDSLANVHDPDFRQAEKDWFSFVEKLTERLVEVDDTIPELPVKDLIFRIYRDVRFSSDPTPYKPHFSAAWSRTGRKGPYAHYYVQVSPSNESFVGEWDDFVQYLTAQT